MTHIYWCISHTCLSSHKSRNTQVCTSKVRKQRRTELIFSYRSIGDTQLEEDTGIRLFSCLITWLAVRAGMCLMSCPMQNGSSSNFFLEQYPYCAVCFPGWVERLWGMKWNVINLFFDYILMLVSKISVWWRCLYIITKHSLESFDNFVSCLALCCCHNF